MRHEACVWKCLVCDVTMGCDQTTTAWPRHLQKTWLHIAMRRGDMNVRHYDWSTQNIILGSVVLPVSSKSLLLPPPSPFLTLLFPSFLHTHHAETPPSFYFSPSFSPFFLSKLLFTRQRMCLKGCANSLAAPGPIQIVILFLCLSRKKAES